MRGEFSAQPFGLASKCCKNRLPDLLRDVAGQPFSLRDNVQGSAGEFRQNPAYAAFPQAPPAAGREKLPQADLLNAIVPILAVHTHGKRELLLLKLPGGDKRSSREDVVQGRKPIAAASQVEDRKILGMPVNGIQHPEKRLRLKECLQILLRHRRSLKQRHALAHSRPSILFVLHVRHDSERLAEVFRKKPPDMAVFSGPPVKSDNNKRLLAGEEEVSELELLMSSLEQLKARDVFASVQQVVPELKKAAEQGILYFAKLPEPLPKLGKEYEYRHEPVDLLKAMYRIYARGGRAAPPDMTAKVPRRIVYSVRDKSLQILNRLREGSADLGQLYRECSSRSEIVATFVSVLELCSIGSVHIEREGESYTLSFIGGNVDEIMEKIVE